MDADHDEDDDGLWWIDDDDLYDTDTDDLCNDPGYDPLDELCDDPIAVNVNDMHAEAVQRVLDRYDQP